MKPGMPGSGRAAVAVALVLMMTVACSSFLRDSYRTLGVTKEVYNVSLLVMGDLYDQGKISDADRDTAISISRTYMEAHNSAVTAWLVYDAVRDKENKQRLVEALAHLMDALERLNNYMEYLKQEKGGHG